jgi:cytidylate kinase
MKTTKIYRVVAYVLGLNGDTTADELKNTIECNKYPEFLKVDEILESECGDWHDDHPLNKKNPYYLTYFPELIEPSKEGDAWLKQEYNRVRGIMISQISKNSILQDEINRLKSEVASLQKVKELVDNFKGVVK